MPQGPFLIGYKRGTEWEVYRRPSPFKADGGLSRSKKWMEDATEAELALEGLVPGTEDPVPDGRCHTVSPEVVRDDGGTFHIVRTSVYDPVKAGAYLKQKAYEKAVVSFDESYQMRATAAWSVVMEEWHNEVIRVLVEEQEKMKQAIDQLLAATGVTFAQAWVSPPALPTLPVPTQEQKDGAVAITDIREWLKGIAVAAATKGAEIGPRFAASNPVLAEEIELVFDSLPAPPPEVNTYTM